MRTCKACGAFLVFIETRTGKYMPCDPERITEWVTDTGQQEITLQDPGGDTLTGFRASATTPEARQIEGFVPHWATCTDPQRFRRAAP